MALELAEEIGADTDIGMAEGNLGMLRLHQGEESEALRLLLGSLERLARVRHLMVAANVLTQLGEVALRQGRAELTLMLIAAGQSVRDRIGAMTPLQTVERQERNVQVAREALPADVAALALTRGRELEFDELVRLALDEMRPVSV